MLDDGVMMGPGLFETVREQVDGGRALAVPYQKASCRGAESAYHPKNIFHCAALSAFGLRSFWHCDASRRLDAAMLPGVAGLGWRLSRVWRERLHFGIWIRFALDGCWELERVWLRRRWCRRWMRQPLRILRRRPRRNRVLRPVHLLLRDLLLRLRRRLLVKAGLRGVVWWSRPCGLRLRYGRLGEG